MFRKLALALTASSLIASSSLAAAAPVRPYAVKVGANKTTRLGAAQVGRAGASMEDSNEVFLAALGLLGIVGAAAVAAAIIVAVQAAIGEEESPN